jgi:hypothetical protein
MISTKGMAVKEGWKGRFFEDFEFGDVHELALGSFYRLD